MVLVFIGVAPITQIRICVIKMETGIQGSSLTCNVVKRIFRTIRTALKGKNSLPLGANSFL